MTKVLFNPPRYFFYFFIHVMTLVISWLFMNLSSICFGVNDMNTITPCVNIHYCSGIFMEETGEQCTVVFALIVMEPASDCLCVWGDFVINTPTTRVRNNLCKGDSTLFSRCIYGDGPYRHGSFWSLWRCVAAAPFSL